MSASQVAEVLGRVPSGLFVLTVQHNGEQTGMLTSWVQQAGFEPPMVTVALKRGRFVAEWLEAGAPFVLNVIEDGQKSLIRHFAQGFEQGEAALEGLEILQTESGAPALAEALGHLECRPQGHLDAGDHRIFLAEVVAGHLRGDGQPYVHVRKNGMKY